MKIAFTGGNSGGHFFPIIAVAEKVNEITDEKKLLRPSLYYFSNSPYNKKLLFENDMHFVQTPSGKLRRSPGLGGILLNIWDMWKTIVGVIRAVLSLFFVYPDVVFGKGGGASFPTLFAARILRIPVVVHESDSHPGRVNLWAGKFSKRVAVSFPEAAQYFNKEKVAVTGQPVRKALTHPLKEGAFEYLKLEAGVPVILILGGSQGAKTINDILIEALPQLVEKYQIIHQTGANNLDEVQKLSGVVLEGSGHVSRYHVFGFLDDLAMRMSAGAATLVISRAGSGIFELALWGIPSIVIPISDSHGDHQRKNAYNFSRSHACVVIEEKNLTPNLLVNEIGRLIQNPTTLETMGKAAKEFAKDTSTASETIARELINICLQHER